MTANRQGPIIHGPAPIQDQHREQEAAGCCGCDKGALLRAPAAEPAPHAHDHAHDHDHDHDHDHQHERIDPAQAASAVAGAAAGELRWTSLRIEAMDCPTEERLLRDALGRVPAVEDLDFNLMQRLLRKPRFLQPHPEWRQRLKRLRLRRRR